MVNLQRSINQFLNTSAVAYKFLSDNQSGTFKERQSELLQKTQEYPDLQEKAQDLIKASGKDKALFGPMVADSSLLKGIKNDINPEIEKKKLETQRQQERQQLEIRRQQLEDEDKKLDEPLESGLLDAKGQAIAKRAMEHMRSEGKTKFEIYHKMFQENKEKIKNWGKK